MEAGDVFCTSLGTLFLQIFYFYFIFFQIYVSILFYGFTISNLDTAFISRSVLHNRIACPGPVLGGTGSWHHLPSSASVPHQAFCLTKLS